MLFADEVPAILGVSIPIVALMIPVVAILSTNWRKAKVAEYRAITVQTMLDKGLSVDEIERVLRASDGTADKLAGKCDPRRKHSEYA
jgi:hypothetical protein